MQFNVKLFATLKSKAQANQILVTIDAEPAAVSDLMAEIRSQYPVLESSMKSVLVAVNGEYAFMDQPLNADDEIALFPPVSGG
jgi:molybdopterin converting factor subunit 1